MVRIVIIGGGPAGTAAAISALQNAGSAQIDITIIESRAFPRNKVCGEFVSPATTSILERLVGQAALRAAGARQVDHLVLALDHREVTWPMPAPAWTLSRRALDTTLLEQARSLGAKIRQPANVQRVEYQPEQAIVHLAKGESLPAHAVIHADGSGRHDLAGPVPCRPGVLGMKACFRPPTAVRGIRMRACRGGYLGTIGVENGLATIAMVARADLLRGANMDIDRLVRGLWPEFDPAWRLGDWLTCGVAASGYTRPGHPRSFRIGNAAAAVEPVGGEGIGLALWSGTRLGEMLGEALRSARGEVSTDRLMDIERRFGREYRCRLRWRRPFCRLASVALARPGFVRLLWPILQTPAISIRPWYGLTGKPLNDRRSSTVVDAGL